MQINLSGRNALVCGASQGIGKSIAHNFALSGANVTVLARNVETIKQVMLDLPNNGDQCHNYIVADLNETESTIEKLDRIVVNGLTFHILVNNTGGPTPGVLYQEDYKNLISAFNQHIVSAQSISSRIIPGMIKDQFGRIINIISIGLKQPIKNLGVSNTIRGALASWAKTLATELGPFGITVNNILPGYTATERLSHLFEHRSKIEGKSIQEIEKSIIGDIPASRLAFPEEIAYAATFLASDLASYINGINLPVDGGLLKTL